MPLLLYTFFSGFYELQRLTTGKEMPNDLLAPMSLKNSGIKALEAVLTRVVARQTAHKQFVQQKSRKMEQGLAKQCRKTLDLAKLVMATHRQEVAQSDHVFE